MEKNLLRQSQTDEIYASPYILSTLEIQDEISSHIDIENIQICYGITDDYDINNKLQDEIKQYASQIKHSNFYGRGTINDYSKLMEAVSNERKQFDLDTGIEEFNDFSNTAEELIQLFEKLSTKMQNINIINDTYFLISISNALEKMCELSDSFIKLKENLLSIGEIRIPKSVHETTEILTDSMVNITCAIEYISHFLSPNNIPLIKSELSVEEKKIIDKAVNIINNANINYDDIKSRLEKDEHIKSIINYSKSIKKSSNILKNAKNNFKDKIKHFG